METTDSLTITVCVSENSVSPNRLTIVALIFVVTAIVGFIGNIFVILGVSVSQKLWNPTGVLIANLAVADLLACVMVPWHSAAMLSSNCDMPPYPKLICDTVAVLVVVCVGCSMYTLAVIGVNRVLLLSRHPAYQYLFTKGKLFLIVIGLWAIPLAITVAPIALGLGSVGYNPKFRVCTQMSEPKTYDKILSIGMCPIPYVTIVVCYWRVYVLLARHATKMAQMNPIDQPLSSADNHLDPDNGKVHVSDSSHSVDGIADERSPNTGSTHSNIQTNISKRQVEITKNLFYVVSAFVICVTPYAICLLVEASDPAMPYTASLMLFNSCINPVIYATKHPYFKQVFRCIIKCRWHEVPKPSRFLKWWLSRSWCFPCKDVGRVSI